MSVSQMPRRRAARRETGAIRRILVYRAGTIGDTIVAVPAIQALRRAYPGASLAFMGVRAANGVWADQVLSEFGWFDDFVVYDRGDLRRAGAMAALLGRVRRLRADMVVHLGSEQNSWMRILRDRAFFSLAGIPRFVGRASACLTWYGRMRTADRVYPSEVTRLLALAVEAGAAADCAPAFDLPIGDDARRRAEAMLAAPGFESGRMLIGLCPGAKLPAKRWPVERYAEICRRLMDAYGASIVIVGGDAERALGDQIGAGWPRSRWLNAATGRLSILDMAELLRRCALYVGNDTGPMHVAAAVGTRCLAVFPARLPGNSWHPYGGDHVVVRRRPSCRNCFLTECVRYQSRCLTETTTDDVWRACERMLVYR